MIQPNYWDLPEELENERKLSYELFSTLYNEKVERIQRNYSRDLTEAQFALNKKDEELLLATEEFLNVLLLQIDRLCRMNAGLNKNLMESVQDVDRLIEGGVFKNRLEMLVAKLKHSAAVHEGA
ncbi:hypothetical protein C8N40_11187 [Pontibacter mucosus]|uniref:Uncharacterized protein n=1 Tax=Pontibacter mucosus TaxID=1649266 RepID=A0A2T5YD21_9BACT|nr:hypothetical protein [Pontibacter mucosus]PTX14422.1 hypothetical protein C8N40_11187 [Pontibacter mucosus]